MRKLIAVGLLCIAGLLTAGLVAFFAHAPMVPIEELAARTNEIAMFSGALLGAMTLAAIGVSMLITHSERQSIFGPDQITRWAANDDGYDLPGGPMFSERPPSTAPA